MRYLRKFEAYVGVDGKLGNFSFEPSSNDLWSDEEFYDNISKSLEYGDEMPIKMYNMISDEHRLLYIKKLLEGYVVTICYSENEDLLKRLFQQDYDGLSKMLLEYMEQYTTFGNECLPFNETFIKVADEILLGRCMTILNDLLEYPLEVSENEFELFPESIQELIKNSECFTIT